MFGPDFTYLESGSGVKNNMDLKHKIVTEIDIDWFCQIKVLTYMYIIVHAYYM